MIDSDCENNPKYADAGNVICNNRMNAKWVGKPVGAIAGNFAANAAGAALGSTGVGGAFVPFVMPVTYYAVEKAVSTGVTEFVQQYFVKAPPGDFTCGPKRLIGEVCTYDRSCKSGYCFRKHLSPRGVCRCNLDNGIGCEEGEIFQNTILGSGFECVAESSKINYWASSTCYTSDIEGRDENEFCLHSEECEGSCCMSSMTKANYCTTKPLTSPNQGLRSFGRNFKRKVIRASCINKK